MDTNGTSDWVKMCEPNITLTEIKAVTRAIADSQISGTSPIIEQFEQQFAAYIGTKHAIAVSSGWAALFLASYALLRGKSVLIPDITMIATPNAVKQAGGGIILGEVDAHGNLDISKSGDFNALMPVHLYGLPVEGDLYNINGFPIIEDCAEAIGARVGVKKVGSLGTAGCFSFYANKILTTGEGGMVTTDNDDLAIELKRLRSHYFGDKDKYLHPELGFNFRMTGLSAALGLAQLSRIDELIAERQRIAVAYGINLDGYVGIPKYTANRVHWMYVIHTEHRDELLAFLNSCKIEVRKYFTPIHRQPQFLTHGDFRKADSLSDTGLLLPMNESKVDFVSDKIIEFLETKN